MAEPFDVVAITEYVDKNTNEKKSRYARVGVAFRSNDGSGFNIYLDALPVNGRLLVRPKKDRDGIGRSTDRTPDDSNIPF